MCHYHTFPLNSNLKMNDFCPHGVLDLRLIRPVHYHQWYFHFCMLCNQVSDWWMMKQQCEEIQFHENSTSQNGFSFLCQVTRTNRCQNRCQIICKDLWNAKKETNGHIKIFTAFKLNFQTVNIC